MFVVLKNLLKNNYLIPKIFKMEEDFSLSVQGADIQTKMPLTTPPALGISVLSNSLIWYLKIVKFL